MAIAFKDIQDANAAIHTTNIKGKEYAEVNQRIKAFRMVYPEGTIKTELLSCEDGIAIFRAEVANNGVILGSGTAYERESSSFINKTSYIENCETSAVGRALGMAGFGIDTSVASYEEVANAMENQKKAELITAAEVKKVKGLIYKYPGEDAPDVRIEKVCKAYGINSLEELNAEQYTKLLKQLGGKE